MSKSKCFGWGLLVFMLCGMVIAQDARSGFENNSVEDASYTLTLGVSPENSGTTDPAVGTHTVGENQTLSITATASGNNTFIGWEFTETVKVDNPSSSSINITMSGDGSLKAIYSTDRMERLFGSINVRLTVKNGKMSKYQNRIRFKPSLGDLAENFDPSR